MYSELPTEHSNMDEEKKNFDVISALQQAINIVSAGLNYHHIEVIMDKQEGEYRAKGSANEFAQVILALLNNAKDALAQSEHSKRVIHISLTRENNMIVLLFCDNGGGIRPDIISKIFHSYVSTKYESGGTGIGLYMSQLIMEQKMQGTIDAYNNEEGACFILKFPSFQ